MCGTRWVEVVQSREHLQQISGPPALEDAVMQWTAKQEDTPSKAEAIRRLIEHGLKSKRTCRINTNGAHASAYVFHATSNRGPGNRRQTQVATPIMANYR